jgi:SAM-dependent methyltransferase
MPSEPSGRKVWDAQALLGLGRAFMEPRVLLSGAELGVFDLIESGKRTVSELVAAIPAEEAPLAKLLDALAALELLHKDSDGRYSCAEGVCQMLDPKSERTILPMLLHSARIWQSWSNLNEAVLGDHAAHFSPPDPTSSFIGAMHVIASQQADSIVARVDPGDAKRLIDVGGASGTYTAAFLRACPAMTATLFDRPDVIEIARHQVARMGLTDRVNLASGDFTVGPLPGGHDLAWLSAVIHSNSPEECLALYRNVYGSLEPGGRIVIRDYVMEDDHVQPAGGALFAINMLVGTKVGGTYSFAEIEAGLSAAGFELVRLLDRTDTMDSLVEGFRPG